MNAIFKREFAAYFRSPVAYVFLVVFQIATIFIAFAFGGFFRQNEASLQSYFYFLPWLNLFLIPAAGMRLWAEEKRTGTIELLFTLPISTFQAVAGKFLAAWSFITLAILLSLPLALTAAYLGDPDWGVIISGYIGSILLSGAFLSLCSLASSLTKNQVISFVLSVIIGFFFTVIGFPPVVALLNAFFSSGVSDAIANFGFYPHFEPFMRGVADLKDLIYFASLSAFSLFLNVVVLER